MDHYIDKLFVPSLKHISQEISKNDKLFIDYLNVSKIVDHLKNDNIKMINVNINFDGKYKATSFIDFLDQLKNNIINNYHENNYYGDNYLIEIIANKFCESLRIETNCNQKINEMIVEERNIKCEDYGNLVARLRYMRNKCAKNLPLFDTIYDNIELNDCNYFYLISGKNSRINIKVNILQKKNKKVLMINFLCNIKFAAWNLDELKQLLIDNNMFLC